MPLRDHFRLPLTKPHSWEELHGQWPAMIVQQLFNLLPDGFFAAPRVHPGSYFEVDVAAFETDEQRSPTIGNTGSNGGVAVATWAPGQPALTVEADLSEPSEYEVLVYDENRGRQLVAAIELVSPSNKDRPEHRRAFVGKCAALLQKGVCVTIVDPVTIREGNLYADLLTLIDRKEMAQYDDPPPLYAVTCRTRKSGRRTLFDAWPHALALGRTLPTLPLWLSEDLAIPLDLEASYEESCKLLRIA